MLITFYSFSALIQFIGAFNFANTFERFHDSLFKYFLDVDSRFDGQFDSIENQIVTDRVSLEEMVPIETISQGSNRKKIQGLIDEYTKLQEEKESNARVVQNTVAKYYKPHFMQSLFLLIGLYCIYNLFFLALMDASKYSFGSCFCFSVLNVFTCLHAVYYVFCEIISICAKGVVHRFFKPTYLVTTVVSVISFGLSFLLYWFNNLIVKHFVLFVCEKEDMWLFLYLGLFIPFFAFLICVACVVLMYFKSIFCINKCADELIAKYNVLHTGKAELDNMYNQLDNDIAFE